MSVPVAPPLGIMQHVHGGAFEVRYHCLMGLYEYITARAEMDVVWRLFYARQLRVPDCWEEYRAIWQRVWIGAVDAGWCPRVAWLARRRFAECNIMLENIRLGL